MLQDGWGQADVSAGQEGVWGLGTFVPRLGTEQCALILMQG